MKVLAALVVVAVLAAVVTAAIVSRRASSKRLMTPEQFAEAVKLRIRTHHPDVTIKRADGFELVLTFKGKDSPIYLNNSYATYRHDPIHFDENVDRLVRVLLETREPDLTWTQARPRLFPALKPQQYLDQTRLLKGGSEAVDDLVVLGYRGDLRILLAIDFDASMTFATKSKLRKWGVTPDEALKCAVENLSKLTAPHWAEATEQARQKGFFAFDVRDGYDSSRLLLPDFCERASRALGCTRMAVGIPIRDLIIAVPAENANQVDRVRNVVMDTYSTGDHPITPDLIFLPR